MVNKMGLINVKFQKDGVPKPVSLNCDCSKEIAKLKSEMVVLERSIERLNDIAAQMEKTDKIIFADIHERLKNLEKRCDQHMAVGDYCPHTTV